MEDPVDQYVHVSFIQRSDHGNLFVTNCIVVDLANGEGLSLELALKSEEMFQSMMDQGKQEHDISAVLEVIEERSK